MERSGSVDEFFGDQSSESDCDSASNIETASNPFGAAGHHDYQSRESTIKTLSYLDGFEETKEEKLQEGFCEGYKQSFRDAFQIGQKLGSLSAKVAVHESLTLSQHNTSNNKPIDKTEELNVLREATKLIHSFLINVVVTGSADKEEDDYSIALEDFSAAFRRYCG